jgi:hypothetical protein
MCNQSTKASELFAKKTDFYSKMSSQAQNFLIVSENPGQSNPNLTDTRLNRPFSATNVLNLKSDPQKLRPMTSARTGLDKKKKFLELEQPNKRVYLTSRMEQRWKDMQNSTTERMGPTETTGNFFFAIPQNLPYR